MNQEKFVIIPNTDNAYSISKNGVIKSNSRLIERSEYAGGNYYTKDKILKPCLNNKGYYYVDLRINKQTKRYLVHRLVALTFIPNPNNLPIVNHKDFNTTNNNVNNLEWCDISYNIQYSANVGRYSKLSDKKKKSVTAPKTYLYHPVEQYTKQGDYIQTFDSTHHAGIWLVEHQKVKNARSAGGNIIAVCKGRAKTCGGYIWKYKEENKEKCND